MSKTLFLSLMMAQCVAFEFCGQTLYKKKLTLKEADECNASLLLAVGEDGKVKQDEKSLEAFQVYRDKFILFSLCEENGQRFLTKEELENLDSTKANELFMSLQSVS